MKRFLRRLRFALGDLPHDLKNPSFMCPWCGHMTGVGPGGNWYADAKAAEDEAVS